MEVEANDVENALKHIVRVSRTFKIFFDISLIVGFVFCIASITPVMMLLAGEGVASGEVLDGLLLATPSLTHGILAVFLIKLGGNFFSDAAKGRSPFTFNQANRVRKAAILFVVYGLFDMVWSPSVLSVHSTSSLLIGSVTMQSAPTITHINAGVFIASVIFFALSIVFRYGVLLQTVSDDTV